MTKIIGLTGYKKTGKTTTTERLIRSLKSRGFRVGSAKFMHMAHMNIDVKGKDTFRHMDAGADFVFALTPKRTVLFNRTPERMDVKDVLTNLPKNVDFLICEGLRSNGSDAYFVLTGKDRSQIDSIINDMGIADNRIIAISGVIGSSISEHAGFPVLNCMDDKELEDLTDAVVNMAG